MYDDAGTPNDSGAERRDGIARLLRAAGRRDGPPPGSYDRTFAVARAAWIASLARRRRRWQRFAVAAACAVLATVAVSIWRLQQPEVVANLDRAIGAVHTRAAGQQHWLALTPAGTSLRAGSALRTDATARIAVRLPDGTSVRLDHATQVEFRSARALRLVAGRVYVDTGAHGRADAATPAGLTITTAAGTVRNIGTQFEVQFSTGTWRVRVRAGRVIAHRAGGETVGGSAGDELLFRGSGALERTRIDARHPDWAWIESVAVIPPTDGQPISVVIDWVARETGRAIRFASPSLAQRTPQAVLHGNIPDLAPLDALRLALASLDLEYTVAGDGALVIRPREPAL